MLYLAQSLEFFFTFHYATFPVNRKKRVDRIYNEPPRHLDSHLSPPPIHFGEVEGCGILKQM